MKEMASVNEVVNRIALSFPESMRAIAEGINVDSAAMCIAIEFIMSFMADIKRSGGDSIAAAIRDTGSAEFIELETRAVESGSIEGLSASERSVLERGRRGRMVVCTSIVSNAQQFGLWREALLYLMMNEMMLEIRSMANCSNEIERIRHIARFVDAMLEMTEDRQFTVEVPGVSAFRASDIGIAIAIGWHVGSRNSMPLPCSVEDLMRSSPGADGGESKSSVTKAMFHSQDSGAAIKTWRSQILLLLSLASKNQKEFASRVRSAQEKEARRSSMRGADIGSPDAKRRRGASASASVAAASASAAPASAGDCGSVVRTACANMVSLDMATNADILVHRMCKNCESLSDVEAVFRRIGADGEESRARLATRMEQALRASGESRMSIFSSKDAAAAREAAAMPPLRAGEIGTGVRVKLVALAPVTAWALVALGKRPALVKGRFAAFHTDLEAARLQDILVFPRVVFEPGPAATA